MVFLYLLTRIPKLGAAERALITVQLRNTSRTVDIRAQPSSQTPQLSIVLHINSATEPIFPGPERITPRTKTMSGYSQTPNLSIKSHFQDVFGLDVFKLIFGHGTFFKGNITGNPHK